MTTRSVWVVALALFALALVGRFPKLGNRPFHADEAVHAAKFRELWEQKSYRYDPNEFHGPTIYYAALPVVAASGHKTFGSLTEADLRGGVAILGAALAPLLLLFRKHLNSSVLLWGGLFFALSPAFVFYSRYFIQEVFLVVFTLLFLAFAARQQAILAGLFAGLMIATKETAILTFFAAGVAWLIARGSAKKLPWRALLVGSGIALASSYLVLSGFFSNPTGPLGYLKTYLPWLNRAGGGGEALHAHPWYDYLERFFWHPQPGRPLWSEGFILLLAFFGALLGRRTEAGKFVVVLALLLMLIYTVIPYKTPWCGLNFLAPLIVLAGMGAVGLIERARHKVAKAFVVLGLLLGTAHLGWLSYQTSFVYFSDTKNPYVYSPTLPGISELKTRMEGLAQTHPTGDKMVVKVVSRDGYYWPIPWYLRKLDNIGYYTGQLPDDVTAPVLLVSPRYEEPALERLPGHEVKGMHGLRLGVFYNLLVEKSLWENYRKLHPPRDDEEE
ncbi:flippase activity-associated protein Agl23 [Armatimonas sp.]|uniref:flippase activity-associated protein Agl23 n=1 Tax=Armatimonas sp. TaxID=1872638 RepID=UPI00286AD99B|nr:flippase activity-associated protein Agl23 [Armatimonas sp.]